MHSLTDLLAIWRDEENQRNPLKRMFGKGICRMRQCVLNLHLARSPQLQLQWHPAVLFSSCFTLRNAEKDFSWKIHPTPCRKLTLPFMCTCKINVPFMCTHKINQCCRLPTKQKNHPSVMWEAWPILMTKQWCLKGTLLIFFRANQSWNFSTP